MDGLDIITIDGPAASGKGSVAKKIANILGYHYLESGLIYRAVALLILQNFIDRKIDIKKIHQLSDKIARSSIAQVLPNINDNNIHQVIHLIKTAKLSFNASKVMLNEVDISNVVFDESIGLFASFYSQIPKIRQELFALQRSFALAPGLVTDGRDMGSVIFPDAKLKIFLTADIKVRALRAYKRYCQLHDNTPEDKYDNILSQLTIRDAQDTNREFAKLKYDDTYLLIDNTNLSLEETAAQILKKYRK
jgi:cytidylate kinase